MMELEDELRPANEAPADDAPGDAADDDELGEPTGVQVITRPDPRRAPRGPYASAPAVSAPAEASVQPSGTEPAVVVMPDVATVTHVIAAAPARVTSSVKAAVSRAAQPGRPTKAAKRAAQARPAATDPAQPDDDDAQPDDDTQPVGPDLLSAVERLRMQVATMSLTLDVQDVAAARGEREGILSQLDDYLLPRLRRRDAPLLAVIGGSTGAGKSTLTNSIVRREVSRSGVLRPTTRSPVLVHHPYDSGAFLTQRILPRLTRVTSEAPEPLQPIDPNAPRITGLRLVPHDGLAPGLAIIDAPDIDSLVETNRDLAVQLLQAADLWIFVTTAARYADAMPWQMLRQAADRGAAVAVVLDRVPPESLQELRIHLATRLRDRGLGGAPMFTIPETQTIDGFLPEAIVAPLQQWLRRVAGDARSRTVIAERTLKGAIGSLPARGHLLAVAADAQAVGWQQLRDEVDDVFDVARVRLLASLIDGTLVRGEVLARWQESIADGEFVRRLDGGPSKLAERVSAAVRRDPELVQPLDVPVTEGIAASIRAATRAATEAVLARWRRYPFGAALLAARGHQVSATDLEARLERAVRDWRLKVSSRIATAVELATASAPQANVDLQTAADVLFVIIVDERSEQGEDGASAGTLAAGRRIVESFLGVQPVRSLAADARADLVARAAVLLDAERRRLERLLENNDAAAGRGEALRTAVQALEAAR
jgi:Dynamin family